MGGAWVKGLDGATSLERSTAHHCHWCVPSPREPLKSLKYVCYCLGTPVSCLKNLSGFRWLIALVTRARGQLPVGHHLRLPRQRVCVLPESQAGEGASMEHWGSCLEGSRLSPGVPHMQGQEGNTLGTHADGIRSSQPRKMSPFHLGDSRGSRASRKPAKAQENPPMKERTAEISARPRKLEISQIWN